MSSNRFSFKSIGIGVVVLLLYLVSTIPVGLALYTLKMDLGWDVFKRSGYHAFTSCVAKEFSIVKAEEERRRP